MKKISLLLLTLTICFFTACHKDIWAELDELDQRVTKLEELCKEMNTNITSLQTIVDVLQSNDFITGVVEIKKDGEVIGYTITFGKHDPITIYHGQDGKDGADGKDGQDGQNGSANAPVIGVAQDTDGVYYWTLNGEWLLDDNGNKLPVSGKDGQNGTNGSNGQDGTDGKDGVTPQLKIEEGYWFISYNNGATWTQLGKATGEDGKDGADGEDGKDGQNGADGKDGQDGDSMFQSVTQDENYVYFTLADGTVIKIAKGSASNDQPNSEFIFTITYDPNGGEGVMQKDTFYYGLGKSIKLCTFTKEGHYSIDWNTSPTGTGASYKAGDQLTIDRNITLYAQWIEPIDLGLSVKWANANIGANAPEDYGYYFAWGEVEPKNTYDEDNYKWFNGTASNNITPIITKYEIGIDDKTTLEPEDDAATVNWGTSWRIPTRAEMKELYNNCTFTCTNQNGNMGYLVTSKINSNSIFLPAAGSRNEKLVNSNKYCYYWSSSLYTDYSPEAYHMMIQVSDGNGNVYIQDHYREIGMPVRPVCP